MLSDRAAHLPSQSTYTQLLIVDLKNPLTLRHLPRKALSPLQPFPFVVCGGWGERGDWAVLRRSRSLHSAGGPFAKKTHPAERCKSLPPRRFLYFTRKGCPGGVVPTGRRRDQQLAGSKPRRFPPGSPRCSLVALRVTEARPGVFAVYSGAGPMLGYVMVA